MIRYVFCSLLPSKTQRIPLLWYHEQTACVLCREDALAVLQLYQLHVKGDPALMTYQELVDHELHNILSSAAGNPD